MNLKLIIIIQFLFSLLFVSFAWIINDPFFWKLSCVGLLFGLGIFMTISIMFIEKVSEFLEKEAKE